MQLTSAAVWVRAFFVRLLLRMHCAAVRVCVLANSAAIIWRIRTKIIFFLVATEHLLSFVAHLAQFFVVVHKVFVCSSHTHTHTHMHRHDRSQQLELYSVLFPLWTCVHFVFNNNPQKWVSRMLGWNWFAGASPHCLLFTHFSYF